VDSRIQVQLEEDEGGSFSGCRPPDLEFFTGARRHGSNTSFFQEALENILTATILLTSTLVVLEVTAVT